jgi:hypothetical protein
LVQQQRARGESKVKKELGCFSTVTIPVASWIIGWSAVSYLVEGHRPHISDGDLFSPVLILLLVVARLLWLQLKLLEGVGDKLGFNSARTERIDVLSKKLGLDEPTLFSLVFPNWSSKPTETQKKELNEELDELTNFDSHQEPAKTGQVVRIIEHLRDLTSLLAAEELALHEDRETETDWERTGQLARIVEQLEHISGLLAAKF